MRKRKRDKENNGDSRRVVQISIKDNSPKAANDKKKTKKQRKGKVKKVKNNQDLDDPSNIDGFDELNVTNDTTCGAITDSERLTIIKRLLCNVLKGSNKSRDAKTAVACGATHTERRMHQMMFDDRDYGRIGDGDGEKERPRVNLVNWHDNDYSVVTVRCTDRPKILFDIVCTLTDMKYVVFHGSVDTEGPEACQVYDLLRECLRTL